MPLQDITITGSIGSIATQSYGQKTYVASSDLESFPIEQITGSHADAWPNFESGTNYTVDLFVNVTQSWSGSNITPLGIVPFVHNTNDEFFNGEFSGSNYVITDGNLTDENSQQFLEVISVAANYSIYYYDSPLSSSFGSYLNRFTEPRNGEILVYYETVSTNKTIKYLKIAQLDQEGNDLTLTLRDLNNLRWTDSGAGEIILNIKNIAKNPTFYLYEVFPLTLTNTSILDNNLLNYTLHATSSATFNIPSSNYAYLTASLVAITDIANGLNNGQYSFPLTPNCNILFTASLSVTASTATTFSFAINGYDPSSPILVPNAVSSIPNPISLIQGANTYYLSPGNYSLTISSSNNFPIQNYLYEVDAYASNNEELLNPNLIGTGSVQNDGDLPVGWRATEGSNPDSDVSSWFSLEMSGPPAVAAPGKPGGVFYVGGDIVDTIFRQDTVGLTTYFDTGKTYEIQIDIPETFINSDGEKFGPSLAPLTCSLNKNNISANIIGYIPSGAFGTFSFIRTAVNNDNELCIYAPSQSSDQSIPHYLTITRASARITSSAVVNNLSFRITQSQIPQSATSSIIYEPYLTSVFTNSDADVLMNNASQNDISGTRRRVLYDNGDTIPSNINQIIAETAELAEVNDYLYNASANTRPRYLGVRSTSPNFNQNSTEGGYGVLPNVESLQTYIAYYSYVTSSYAELLNKSIAHIKYLIDKDGEILIPSISSSYYYNLIDNFETGKRANITLDATDTILTIGLKNILRPGAIPRAIVASQTGSTSDFYNTMSFGNTTSTTVVPNYASLINHESTQSVFIQTRTDADFSSSAYVGAGITVSNIANSMSINTTSPIVSLNFKVTGFARLTQVFSGAPKNEYPLYIELWKSTDGGISYSKIDSQSTLIIRNQNITIDTTLSSIVPQANDRYQIRFYNESGYFRIDLYNFRTSIIQVPIPTNLGEITSSYWFTGSNSRNILTGSQFLQIYNSYRAFQANFPNSGYKDFLEFDIRPADEIRFSGDENQVYSIYNVSSDDSALYLQLDRNIVNGTNLNSFLIRRYEPNPNFITFDWDGVEANNGDGFIFPEFMTNELQQNFNKIIINLRERALI